MRLEGSIDAFSLPDIFSLLSMTKKTGGLHLRRDGAHGVVWFTTGAITGGSSDVSRQSLARRIVGAGLVSDDELQAAVDRALQEELGVVRALQQSATVDDGALHDLTAEHVVDTVFDLLRWAEGDFAFVVDEANPDDVGVSRQAEDVVTEARRRLEVWSGVATTIPSPDTVLSLVASPDSDPQLARDEWALLALVDGRRTVGEIVSSCGRGDFAVASGLAELVTRGLLRIDGGDGVEALLRRQNVLRALEPATTTDDLSSQPEAAEPVDEPVDEPGAEPVHEVAAPQPTSPYEVDDELLTDADVVMAPVTEIPRAPKPPAPRTEVTPQRPEPVLPARRPEHAEEPRFPAAAAAGGGTATPAAASLIERDPNVNKSLLLRLIAGVRGL